MNRVLVPLALLATCLIALWGADRLGTPASADESAAESETLGDPLAVPVLSARRLPEALKAPLANATLIEETEAVLENSPANTCLVVTDDNGVVLQAHNANTELVPASTQKLVTAVAALLQLGDDYRFTTSLVAPEGITPEGTVGDVYLVGGGDPVIMTPDYVSSFRDLTIYTDPRDFVDELRAAGVKSIDGRILGVGTRYDDSRYPEAWPSRFAEQGQSGPLSALMINDAFVQWPATPTERDDAAQLGTATSASPETHAASTLADLLTEAGIPVASGGAKADGEFDVNTMETIAAVESPPLGDIIGEMLTFSDNTTAELLTKELGLVVNSVGATALGTDAIVEILGTNGLGDLRILNLVDGSGLSEENRLTCGQLVGVLNFKTTRPLIHSVLPVAGETGTLWDRFQSSSAKGRLNAKTGSLLNATALAGYVTNSDDQELTFAYIANTAQAEAISDELKAEQEPLGEAMANYPAGPSIEDIAPPGEARRVEQEVLDELQEQNGDSATTDDTSDEQLDPDDIGSSGDTGGGSTDGGTGDDAGNSTDADGNSTDADGNSTDADGNSTDADG